MQSRNETKFYPPDPEEGDERAKCPECGEIKPVSKMGLTMDQVDRNSEDVVIHSTRYYLCSDECMGEMMFKMAGDA